MPSWTTSPAESMLRISRNSLSVSLMPVSIHTTGKLKQAAQIIATSRAVNTGGPHGRWPEGAAGSLMERIKAWTRIDGLTVHGAWRSGGGWRENGARGGTRTHMALRPGDFKSPASTIPPPGQGLGLLNRDCGMK